MSEHKSYSGPMTLLPSASAPPGVDLRQNKWVSIWQTAVSWRYDNAFVSSASSVGQACDSPDRLHGLERGAEHLVYCFLCSISWIYFEKLTTLPDFLLRRRTSPPAYFCSCILSTSILHTFAPAYFQLPLLHSFASAYFQLTSYILLLLHILNSLPAFFCRSRSSSYILLPPPPAYFCSCILSTPLLHTFAGASPHFEYFCSCILSTPILHTFAPAYFQLPSCILLKE